ncbi:MAG: antitoxin family protein [Acidobacteria bacterium]|nr:antitoxin family protein [Acidobacteriota bacterium]MBI3428130.1 antitoxin family protein [Acidobacteriota bacterium]
MCIECVFEGGVLKPLESVDLVEGQRYIVFFEEVRGDESAEEKKLCVSDYKRWLMNGSAIEESKH